MFKRLWPVLIIPGLALASCAKERDPISRVQPNALEKKFFVGESFTSSADDPEFYMQSTLIDVGYGASQDGLFTSTYAQPVTRIKWVVQEDLLIARLTYERVDGSDGKGAGATATDGQVVAAYDILSHFDIRRAYNPITGEEMNVIEENTTDRPWYEREYMRVDWSKNKNTNAYELDMLSQLGIYGGIEYEPLAYYVNDPEHVDAPHFQDDYFDVTNKAFATPKKIDLTHLGWGIDSFPACWLPPEFAGGSDPVGNCNPVELTIRNSFRHVVDNDYEPKEWDGFRFQAFGAFTTERKGYARNYGMSDDKWRRFISRYSIWERSHAYADPVAMTGAVACFTPDTTPVGADPHRDADANGTEDECEAVGAGSLCDEFQQRCTLPYRQRTVKPIVWYYTDGSHPEYFEPTREAAAHWDVAMRAAVVTARYAECMRVEQSPGLCREMHPVYFGQQDDNDDALALTLEVLDCRYGRAYAGQDCNQVADSVGSARGYDPAVAALAKGQEMVVLCHGPVQSGDPAACGEAGTSVRPGDLRFHHVNVIPTPQSPSPWGIYTDAHDPLTGETISASINVWSHVNDLWSQGVVDKLRYIAGELTTAEVTEATYVKDWVDASERATGRGILPGISRAQLDSRVADFAGVDVDRMAEISREMAGRRDVVQAVTKMQKDLRGIRADSRVLPSTRSTYEARRKRAIGSPLEAELNTRQMQELVGVSKLGVSADTTAVSSPLQGGRPDITAGFGQMREIAMGERGACVRYEAPSPTSLSGLADILQAKFGQFNRNDSATVQSERAEQMRRFLGQRAHFSVILHEMGHSIGMRHNFVSSSDAWGYRPQYWQLRTKNGADLPECTDLTTNGESCVGPRWFDPMTGEERDQLLWMFMHSSVMDYAGEYTQDMLGLGAYDFAATRMFYGDALAVHADPSYANGTPRGTAMLSKADDFGGILGYQFSTNGDTFNNGIHYSQLQRHFDLINDCQSVDPAQYRPASWDEATKGVWNAVLDGQIVSVNGQPSRCRQQRVDYVDWDLLRPATNDEAGGFSRGGRSIDPQGRTRVPYGFATDRWADLGNLAVYRHDNGADPYELFNFFVTEQEVNHLFDNYRRRRQSFNVRSAAERSLGRYNEKMRDGAKGLGLFTNIYRDFSLAEGFDFGTLWPFIVGPRPGSHNSMADNVLAAGLAFDHFTRMMARPEPGEHFIPDGQVVLRSTQDSAGNPRAAEVIIPNGPTGYWDDVGIGGKPVENALADDKGEYDSDYTINVGSYYDKVYSTMLLTESVDNFISDSRRDFTDARYRAVSMADLFPEGYRRWLANNLTNDERLKAVWVRAQNSRPMVDESMFPSEPLGWTSWWTAEPQACFPAQGSTVCTQPFGGDLGGEVDPNVIPLDSEVGWEQQKFLVAWTLLYLPENQQRTWLDMMAIWNLGDDSDPGFANRIELHDPNGQVYIAKTFGKETIFGKRVQRGMAARILEFANELLDRAYVTDPGPDLDGDGTPDWRIPRIGINGETIVKYDPLIQGRIGCNGANNSDCDCSANRACVELSRYVSLPAFVRQALSGFGLAFPSMKGLF